MADISGTNGDDSLLGTPGDDEFVISRGNDTLDGGGGNDKVVGTAASLVIDLGAGTVLYGGNTQILHNIQNAEIYGDGSRLTGSDGNNWLTAIGTDVTVDGGAGRDRITTEGMASGLLGGGAGRDTFAIYGKGAVTISTNMAGRGTDIILGGNPEFLAREDLVQQGKKIEEKMNPETEELYHRLIQKYRQISEEEHNFVVEKGGLHVIGTERHESRRIDNQLRGRAGRQGDPGSSRFFLSLEDDLLRLFGSERISGIMDRLGVEEGVPIEHTLVTRAIEGAQKKVEGYHFNIRKTLLQYDDVMNKQREVIYNQRRTLLTEENLRPLVFGMLNDVIQETTYLQLYIPN